MSRLAILVVIQHYLPGTRAGGPVRTTSNMIGWLGQEIDFKVITTDRDYNSETAYKNITPRQWHSVGHAEVYYLATHEQSLKELQEHIRSVDYDILYLDSVFAPISMKTLLLKRLGRLPSPPIVIAPRGQLHPGALSLKSTKKRTFLMAAKAIGLYRKLIWHATSQQEHNNIRSIFGDEPDIWVGSNPPMAVDEEDAYPRKIEKDEGIAKLVFLSRVTRKKRIDYALDILKQVEHHVIFDIYGPIEDDTYWQACQRQIALLPDNIDVAYHGEVTFDQVLDVFSNYHGFLFPTMGENFGHVILESLYAGCPVIMSDQTPWVDVPDKGAGWSIPLEQPAQFVDAINTLAEMDQEAFNHLAQRAHEYGHHHIVESDSVDRLRAFFEKVGRIT